MNEVFNVTFNECPDPPKQGTYPPDKCWRCGGRGFVNVTDEETTPCGACLNIEPPKPCPKCQANQAKMRIEMFASACCWWCRACGFKGPTSLVDSEALELWNKLPRATDVGVTATVGGAQ